jgi:hypothetical protein
MPITNKTRKILWIRAGGRCSICREQLATDPTDDDDPSVFGEECHIVAQSPGGPRASEIDDIDGPDNLILLCRKHHKQVDDQWSHFTVERLKQIKADHEQREAEREKHQPMRLIPDPTRPTPNVLKLCLTGQALWEAFEGSMSFYPSSPEGLNDEQGEAVDALFDDLSDWIHVASELSYRERRQAGKSIGEHIRALAGIGLFVGARARYMLLTGGVYDDSSSWRTCDIQVQRVAEAELAEADGTPFAAEPTPTGQTHESQAERS